ncbi:hypothetical protein [Gordonia soli]|uniref:Minor tail protein n=1 Tax=Gordonia soli NBRC 108243 TaxID=1223545 RepID=M0QQU1_9ACTN|nr:hypothetical protein [Gordonia soli]GAC71045.1 hypothetical protein GS4_47_00350 [Gordonia soli NBRC 108243]
MADDPIERLAVELEIYGIPQPAGSPPMTDSYLHIRRRQDGAAERAVMGLPAYEGKQGPPGPPGAIHQGERTTAELTALASVLTTDMTNWAYRNTNTNDQYVWTGETFVIYHGVYGTPGPTGPAPTLNAGSLTIDGEEIDDPAFGVRVTGGSGSYAVGVDLPEMPKGDKGDPGASGPFFTSVDVDQTKTKNDGDVFIYNATVGKLQPSPGGYWIEEYVIPPSQFPTVSKLASDVRHTMFTVVIPAKTFAYRFDFTGGVDVSSSTGTQIDMEIRKDNATTGAIVGYGKGQDGEGYREVAFRAHSDVAINPDTRAGVIESGTEVTLYASAVKKAGSFSGWNIRNTNAQLRVRLLRVR